MNSDDWLILGGIGVTCLFAIGLTVFIYLNVYRGTEHQAIMQSAVGRSLLAGTLVVALATVVYAVFVVG